MGVWKKVAGLICVIFVAAFVYGWSGGVDGGGILTGEKRIALSIFCTATFLWITEWVPLFITSFLVLFFGVVFFRLPESPYSLFSQTGCYDAFFHPFFSPVIALFPGSFAVLLLLYLAAKIYWPLLET
ncbi:hypothetical protein BSNK01_01890 [Bacillaceae bacterium]